ncbi:hypothetical protein HK100_009985 [Physocladia obscura]|uniref:UBX domain-containing protein n=1 Tax=Physocladia obscura TaxID=109957 RepID=A0AAD5XJ23_9FUNG|nr:hypothetical protein HK100_009985 [Physocladia obscura]
MEGIRKQIKIRMASQVTVEIEGVFPTKRVIIKTTPAMSLNDVLRAAIDKAGARPGANYMLKYGKNTLDLSLSVRFANLPAGAKLLLSPAPTTAKNSTASSNTAADQTNPSAVQSNDAIQSLSLNLLHVATIALQIQDGPRVILKSNINNSLWDILKTAELQDSSLNLTHRETEQPITPASSKLPAALKAMSEASKKIAASQLPRVYAFPLLILGSKEYSTFNSLKNTSLAACGLRGGTNALIRLLWKIDVAVQLKDVLADVDEPWEQPKTSTVLSDTPPSIAPDSATVAAIQKSIPSFITTPTTNKPIIHEKDVAVELNKGDFERNIKVFAPPPTNFEGPTALKIQLPDSFFELNPTELKLAYISTKDKAKTLTDAPLMTKAMRDREDELRARKWPKTMIRVRFPDRVTFQAAFLSSEPLSTLYNVVEESLRKNGNGDARVFVLYVTPPLQDLSAKRSLSFWKAGLAPASMVYFKWVNSEASGSYLNDYYLSKIEEFPVPPVGEVLPEISSTVENMEIDNITIPVDSTARLESEIGGHREFKQSDYVAPKKVPKWFKIGKK